jgi:hypothetical protein
MESSSEYFCRKTRTAHRQYQFLGPHRCPSSARGNPSRLRRYLRVGVWVGISAGKGRVREKVRGGGKGRGMVGMGIGMVVGVGQNKRQ